MKIFKFGGASVNSLERIQHLPAILDEFKDEQLVVIVSAMGKTTNSLEKVVESFYAGNTQDALLLFDAVKRHHLTLCKYLLVTHFNECLSQLTDFFTEVEWLLHDKPVRGFDYYYDQVVCVGELLSTAIISHYLNESGVNNEWQDVRDLLRTDDNFRDAGIDWAVSSERIKKAVNNEMGSTASILITQGFIGATVDNESTTLGREGSDYTAAVFAHVLDAESVTIWKDVEGVMNADPKRFPSAQLIAELNFAEVIEMAFYGAQVIHPKTIKPLQNKNIPLQVKCFLDPSLPGTLIHSKHLKQLPPIIVLKEAQALLHLHTQDFSFVGEEPMSQLYRWLEEAKLRPNLIQTGAISVQVCLDDRAKKIDQLAASASSFFDVHIEKDLTLLTIRHYTQEVIDELTAGKQLVLVQRSRETIQVLFS